VIIQGAWLAAKEMNDFEQFFPFRVKMAALLEYWERQRLDPDTSLYVWYNQMESGADNLPLISKSSSNSEQQVLSAPDVMTFMYRECQAFVLFLQKWALTHANSETDQQISKYQARLKLISQSISRFLWRPELKRYCGFNVKTKQPICNRVFLMAFPLFGRVDSVEQEQAEGCLAELMKEDMCTPFGIRSTSSLDPAYNNANIIVPDSNWQGPVWIISNCLLAYAASNYGWKQAATDIAIKISRILKEDLEKTGVWHECYDSETGEGLAGPGFLSWNVLAATLLDNLKAGKNPFDLAEL